MSNPLEQLQAEVNSVDEYEPFMLEGLEVEGWAHVETHHHDANRWHYVVWEVFRHESGVLAAVEWFSGLTEYQEDFHYEDVFPVNAELVHATTYSKAELR